MKSDEASRLLDQGERIGFRKATSDPDYLGWILVSKLRPNLRVLEVLDEADASPELLEERRRRLTPYMILRIELRRDVHEGGGYETEADYRQKERIWLGTLAEVEETLSGWGYALTEAKSARDLDAP